MAYCRTCSISCFLSKTSVSITRSASSYRGLLSSCILVRVSRGLGTSRSGRRTLAVDKRATSRSGDALRYMIRPVGRKSATASRFVIHPPPADIIVPLQVTSSRVRSRSSSRNRASPWRSNISTTDMCCRCSISVSKSMNGRWSCFATLRPIVVLPLPESPTRMMLGTRTPAGVCPCELGSVTKAADASLRSAGGTRSGCASSHSGNRRRIFRSLPAPLRTRASLRRSLPWRERR